MNPRRCTPSQVSRRRLLRTAAHGSTWRQTSLACISSSSPHDLIACTRAEEEDEEQGDLAGPLPPGLGDAVDDGEGDLVGPAPPPQKKRKVPRLLLPFVTHKDSKPRSGFGPQIHT